MSDSKKDLTRIEDLGEYLHQLDDNEDYLPDLPDESEPSAFMEETLISDLPSLSGDEETPSFESDISEFGSETSFESETSFGESSFGETNDFSSADFNSENSFESSESFGQTTAFETNNDFSTEEDPFAENNGFEPNNEFGSDFSTEDSPEPHELNNSDFSFDDKQSDSIESTLAIPPLDEGSEETMPMDMPPLEDERPKEVVEKTPLPRPEIERPYKAPENFEDLKKFAESSSFTGMASEGNPSFSVLIKDIKYTEDAQDILVLLKELGLAMDEDEVLIKRLSRGEFLVPRISEFAATLLTHKLRRFDIDILIGPSEQIQPPKNGQDPELGLVSKLSLYQNQSHHFQFDDFNLDISQVIISATPTLDGYQVHKYIGVASEHKMLEGHLVEDENSLEISSHYQELAHRLKAHALKNHANAVVGLNYQLTPLPSSYGTSYTRYRLTCTGNLVWINKL